MVSVSCSDPVWISDCAGDADFVDESQQITLGVARIAANMCAAIILVDSHAQPKTIVNPIQIKASCIRIKDNNNMIPGVNVNNSIAIYPFFIIPVVLY